MMTNTDHLHNYHSKRLYCRVINIKSKTIFSRLPFIHPAHTESRKLSYWLEKLHIQGERVRKDNNRREELSKIASAKKPLNEQLVTKEIQNPIQSGINENTKNIAIKKAEDRQIVNDLVKKSNRSIIRISSQFPWELFPSTIEVEESRVTFHFNQFLSSQSHSVDMKDISNVFIESSIFFSTLQVVSRTFVQNEIKVGYLNKERAKKVQRIIEGLRTFEENNINTSNYEIAELISKIEEFHNNKWVG
ncbi:MAG TPA: hypothetical protein VNW29_05410 [Candidatus Sulfotelmatobacter sp.]|jgi:hypothetical protein|nr:hypothetical protein [Candidatus Sulfotelmatobacter sp.]